MFYPTIGNTKTIPAGAFNAESYQKYDGSNIGFTWDTKNSWTKVQSRNQYIDRSHSLGRAIDLFHDEYAINIPLKGLGIVNRAIYFFEYFGPNSFAGSHKINDNMELRLFDVAIDDKLIDIKQFNKHFSQLPFVAEHLGQVYVTKSYFNKIRKSMTLGEGIVLKGKHNKIQWRAKIKTYAYMDRLKNQTSDSWRNFWE